MASRWTSLRPISLGEPSAALRFTALAVLGIAALAACSPGTSETASATVGSSAGGSVPTASSTDTSSASTTATSSSSAGGGGSGGAGGAGGGSMSMCLPDADGDNLSDTVEGKATMVDTDGDKTPDYLDLDSDNDSIPDKIEGQTAFNGCMAPQNSDSTDEPDWRDTDSDNNGLLDIAEVYPDGKKYDPQHAAPNPADTDGDKIPDYADPDNDNDSLPDAIELAMGVAVDTDGDGIPDLDDIDSDNDTIADSFEGLADPDADMTPAFRDLDSDGDGRSDMCEAGPNHKLADPPPDTDGDGKYDFLDLDSDADGLPDAVEDANANCIVDPGETDPLVADTDGDGASDFIETVLASDPTDPNQTPGTLGKYYFVLPYMQDPQPLQDIVALHTDLNQGDLAFVVDTTSSMGGELMNLKNGLQSIITAIKQPPFPEKPAIPDLGVAIAGHDDFPIAPHGTPGIDLPFYIGPTGYVSTDLANNLGALSSLNIHDGGDLPESQIAAYNRALTDNLLVWPGGMIAKAGAPGGTSGSVHFRDGSLPIIVGITDAPFHNGRKEASPGSLHDAYEFNGQLPFPTPTIDDLVTNMNAVGARYIGISASNGVRVGGDPYEDMAYLTDHVNSNVSPKAFGGVLCGTGLNGSFGTPDGPATADDPSGTCRLVFDINTTGVGLSTSVVNGVVALLKSIHLNVRVLAAPDPGDPLDAVDEFVDSISVNTSGGNDEQEPGTPCIALDPLLQLKDLWTGPKGLIQSPDGVNETALNVIPSQKICFKMLAKQNMTVMQDASPHVYRAYLTIKARNGQAPTEYVLGTTREVAFIVPPAPQ